MGFRKCVDEGKLPNLVTFEGWGGISCYDIRRH